MEVTLGVALTFQVSRETRSTEESSRLRGLWNNESLLCAEDGGKNGRVTDWKRTVAKHVSNLKTCVQKRQRTLQTQQEQHPQLIEKLAKKSHQMPQ